MQLADYDWMAMEPGSKASDYLVDLIGFLRSTFAVFTHLPVSNLSPFAFFFGLGSARASDGAVWVAQALWNMMESGP